MLNSPRPKKPHLLVEWVKYELRLKGSSFSEIARQNGCARETISRTFSKRMPKWEKVVAAAMGMTPEELWPERYPKLQANKQTFSRPKSTKKVRGVQ